MKRLKPLIKWAGGKTRLLDSIMARVPEFKGTYCEPFVGGGAVLLALQPKRFIVNDANAELINLYRVVRDTPHQLCDVIDQMPVNKERFLKVRAWDRIDDWPGCFSVVDRAARFMYLNRTCFNGLWRVNSKGFFNVPWANVKPDKKLYDRENLMAVSDYFHSCDLAEFACGDFRVIELMLESGDFAYIDPPYVPTSATAGFVGYTQDGFGHQDQEDLRDMCGRLQDRRIHWLLSNSETGQVLDLYDPFFYVETVSVRRSISAKASTRGNVNEVLVQPVNTDRWAEYGEGMAGNETRVDQLAAIQDECRELFARKNHDYGDSFAEHGPVGVLVRLADKLKRFQKISSSGVQLVNDEGLRDTLKDLHNYAAMAIMLLDEAEQ